MEAYCPSCNALTTAVDADVLQQGECPKCGGQLSLGAIASDVPLDGAVAMTFVAGSRVAMPLDASFEQTRLDLEGEGEMEVRAEGSECFVNSDVRVMKDVLSLQVGRCLVQDLSCHRPCPLGRT